MKACLNEVAGAFVGCKLRQKGGLSGHAPPIVPPVRQTTLLITTGILHTRAYLEAYAHFLPFAGGNFIRSSPGRPLKRLQTFQDGLLAPLQ